MFEQSLFLVVFAVSSHGVPRFGGRSYADRMSPKMSHIRARVEAKVVASERESGQITTTTTHTPKTNTVYR